MNSLSIVRCTLSISKDSNSYGSSLPHPISHIRVPRRNHAALGRGSAEAMQSGTNRNTKVMQTSQVMEYRVPHPVRRRVSIPVDGLHCNVHANAPKQLCRLRTLFGSAQISQSG